MPKKTSNISHDADALTDAGCESTLRVLCVARYNLNGGSYVARNRGMLLDLDSYLVSWLESSRRGIGTRFHHDQEPRQVSKYLH
jgi:hypothetical protein